MTLTLAQSLSHVNQNVGSVASPAPETQRPLVVYEPVQVVSAATVEREADCSPGESTMI
jgi:hypothetical protein